NAAAIQVPIKIFACPSTPEDPFRRSNGAATGPAISDYGATNEVTTDLVARPDLITRPADHLGILHQGPGVPLHRVRDGASNTILVTEDAGRPAPYLRGGVIARVSYPFREGCGNPSVPADGRVTGAAWADPNSDTGLHGFRQDGLQCVGPCPIN